MTCDEILESGDDGAIAAHVAECGACRAIRLLRSAPWQEPPADAWEAHLRRRSPKRRAWWAAVAAAAALLVAVLAGGWALAAKRYQPMMIVIYDVSEGSPFSDVGSSE